MKYRTLFKWLYKLHLYRPTPDYTGQKDSARAIQTIVDVAGISYLQAGTIKMYQKVELPPNAKLVGPKG